MPVLIAKGGDPTFLREGREVSYGDEERELPRERRRSRTMTNQRER
jgi:hypothetical protein